MKTILRRMVVPGALVLAAGGAATAIQTTLNPAAATVGVADAQAALEPGPELLAASFRAASREALAGVVHVQVEALPRQVSQPRTPEIPGFPGFPGAPDNPRSPRLGSGSGFIISADGYILTNDHVVENATRVTVTLTDRRQFEATVVGRDPNTDVAVLKVEAAGLPTVRIGNSDAMEVGDWVLALGYPLSLGETVTAGIVSAKGKNLGIMRQNESAVAPLEHFIQTDAAINPGNSGGPLVNLRGEAVGINSAIASPTGSYSGYGFAVPIALAKRVADDLIRYGAVRRPRLAVEIRDVEPADVEVFGLRSADGSVVAVVQEGPAKSAGVRMGDVVVAVDGRPIRDTGDLMERIALRQPGDRVALDVIRYGETLRLAVTLGAFDSAPATPAAASAPARDPVGRLGFAAAEIDPALASRLGLRPDARGVIITRVEPAGPAPRSLEGLRVDRVNGREIQTAEDLAGAASGLRPGDVVSIVGTRPTGEETIVNYRLR
jgi:serine protease Do